MDKESLRGESPRRTDSVRDPTLMLKRVLRPIFKESQKYTEDEIKKSNFTIKIKGKRNKPLEKTFKELLNRVKWLVDILGDSVDSDEESENDFTPSPRSSPKEKDKVPKSRQSRSETRNTSKATSHGDTQKGGKSSTKPETRNTTRATTKSKGIKLASRIEEVHSDRNRSSSDERKRDRSHSPQSRAKGTHTRRDRYEDMGSSLRSKSIRTPNYPLDSWQKEQWEPGTSRERGLFIILLVFARLMIYVHEIVYECINDSNKTSNRVVYL